MTVKIIRASDPLDPRPARMLIMGQPGAGKTTMGFTAERPLLLDFDEGIERAIRGGDAVTIGDWSDVADLSDDDLEPYATLVVDTVGRCLDCLSREIINRDSKLGMATGALTLGGYGALKAQFAAWANKIRSFGKDLVLFAHLEEKMVGDSVLYRPAITGGSYNEVFYIADATGTLRWDGRNRRLISWKGSDQYVGKNPAEWDTMEVPHVAEDPRFLANLLADLKSSMGRMSQEAQEVVAIVSEWTDKIAEANSAPEAVNALVAEIGEASSDLPDAAVQQVKSLVARHARESGMEWDKGQGGYVLAETEEGAESSE